MQEAQAKNEQEEPETEADFYRSGEGEGKFRPDPAEEEINCARHGQRQKHKHENPPRSRDGGDSASDEAVHENSRAGAVTDQLQPAQFRRVMEQRDTVPQDGCHHPEQEEKSGGEAHPGRFSMTARTPQGFSRFVRQAGRFGPLLNGLPDGFPEFQSRSDASLMFDKLPSLRGFQPRFYSGGPMRFHLPLLYDLVASERPKLVVTVGWSDGEGFFTLCQAASEQGVDNRCVAVRRERTGESEEYDAAWRKGRDYGEEFYGDRTRFFAANARALAEVADGSIDLLLLDDCDSGEELQRDLSAWESKLAPGGIV